MPDLFPPSGRHRVPISTWDLYPLPMQSRSAIHPDCPSSVRWERVGIESERHCKRRCIWVTRKVEVTGYLDSKPHDFVPANPLPTFFFWPPDVSRSGSSTAERENRKTFFLSQ